MPSFCPSALWSVIKALAQLESISAEHLKYRRAEAAFGDRSPKRKNFQIGSPFFLASDCNLDIFAFTLFVTDFLYIPQLDNISSGVLWP